MRQTHVRKIDLGLQDMTPEQAAAAGAGSLLLGLAPAGGVIPEAWYPTLMAAVNAGLDIVSGSHSRLTDIPGLAAAAAAKGVALVDVRHPRTSFPTGTGRRRTGKRLLTVGTDCALGKKYAALALTAEFLGEVASRCEFTGGQIRNVTLHAALLALDNGGVVKTASLESAIRREYAKQGAVCPLRHFSQSL